MEENYRLFIDGMEWELILIIEAGITERPFKEDEIRRTMRDLGSDKAPDPDGFTIEFREVFDNGVISLVTSVYKIIAE